MARITGIGSLNRSGGQQPKAKGVFAGRVRYCVLDKETNPQVFNDFGEWSSIGCIFYSRLGAPSKQDQPYSTDNFAKPLFPSNKNFPLENEVVYIIALPSANVQKNVQAITYYYFQPINIWMSTHHNAIPDPVHGDSLPPSQQSDYQESEAGAVRRVTDGGTEIDLGETFKEKLDIRNLQPYEGDIFHEGRWGQSIRFGSTVKNASIPNPWSDSGNDGDPIVILRNGQTEQDEDPWVPILENINSDKSSIYLTSTQRVPLGASNTDYASYTSPWGETPTKPGSYAGSQVMLNSGRLVFNTKSDHIILSSQRTIAFGAQTGFNFDTPANFVVKVGGSGNNTINLGAKKDDGADEPLILGNEFLKDFTKLVNNIITTSLALQTPIGTPAPFIPNPAVPAAAVQLQTAATTMLNKMERYKSKITFTK